MVFGVRERGRHDEAITINPISLSELNNFWPIGRSVYKRIAGIADVVGSEPVVVLITLLLFF